MKNSFQRSPPISPTKADVHVASPISEAAQPPPPLTHQPSSDLAVSKEDIKEATKANTQYNAGHRRSSSAGTRGPLSRRQSSRAGSEYGADDDDETSPRLKWDEANLYLAEQERTATMKITEPKTPYAKHYDPADDPSDEELDPVVGRNGHDAVVTAGGVNLDLDKIDGVKDVGRRKSGGGSEDEIPGLSLGEPEGPVPDDEFGRRHRAVHVNSDEAGYHDQEPDELAGMSPEEREKHRRFEAMRKKHYEMKNVAKFLGHPEELEDEMDEDDDDDEKEVPPVPSLPKHVNGS